MQSVPIYEAKNKLPLFIHMVEQGDSFLMLENWFDELS